MHTLTFSNYRAHMPSARKGNVHCSLTTSAQRLETQVLTARRLAGSLYWGACSLMAGLFVDLWGVFASAINAESTPIGKRRYAQVCALLA